jgi:hypothetical protein
MFSPESQARLLDRLAETYFRTPGAVTSAVRALSELLNNFLLDRNLRAAHKGLQATGLLTQLVLRGDLIYIVQSGPTHVFTVESGGANHLYQLPNAGHGLGLGKSTNFHITHIKAEAGNLVILSPQPPPDWDMTFLQGTYDRDLKSIHQSLLSSTKPDLNAILLRVYPGKGAFRRLKPVPAARDEMITEGPGDTVETGDAAPVEEESARPEAITSGVASDELQEAARPAEKVSMDATSTPGTEVPPETRGKARQADLDPEIPVTPPPKPPRKPFIGPLILTIGRAFASAGRQILQSTINLLSRLLPGSDLFTIPSSVMAFIAIAVPVVLVTISSVVYLRRGRLGQFETYLQYAEASKVNALGKSESGEKRIAWEAVLFYLERAEEYQRTAASEALRMEAQAELDGLDGTERLDFRPALREQLADSVQIKRIAATSEDLYLLNGNGGNVIHALLTGRGYEADSAFRCGPGSYGSYLVGPLIDIAPLPPNNELGAVLIAMDANGILVYCLEDKPPVAIPLAPPDSNWGEPVAFTLDIGILYVLDPKTNAVWIYEGDGSSFIERPEFFFGEDVPPLEDVIDLTINRGELFLLHADGHITNCTYSFGIQPTRCNDPLVYTDPRPGREDEVVIEGTQFSEIAFVPPPDPSIYLLDPIQQAVYHFSLRLTLQRQYRPPMLGEINPQIPASSFALSPNRTIFLAHGNQVYVAALP